MASETQEQQSAETTEAGVRSSWKDSSDNHGTDERELMGQTNGNLWE